MQPEQTVEREAQQEVINEENLDQEDEGRTEPAQAQEEPMEMERPNNRALPKRGHNQDPEEEIQLRRSKRIRRAVYKRFMQDKESEEQQKRRRIKHVWRANGVVCQSAGNM